MEYLGSDEDTEECVVCLENQDCAGELDYCSEEQQCVACLGDSHCPGGRCDTEENICVECIDAPDCEDPALPMCVSGTCESGCQMNDDCAEHVDTVCDAESGGCVECLSADDCGGKVCEPETLTCTDLDAGILGACDECQYDAQCATGRVCVEMTYSNPIEGVVGNFCLWRMDAELPGPNGSCGLNSQPFAQEASVTSVNGTDPVIVCELRTTTCPGLKDHAVDVTGCETEFVDDAACGAETFNDGRCRGSGSALCTYACGGSDDRDCPGGFSCIDDAGDKYCGI